MSAKTIIFAGVIGASLLGLSACNRNQASADRHDSDATASSAPARGSGAQSYASTSEGGYRSSSGGYSSGSYSRGQAREATPMFHGEPMWSDNRSHTAKENAEYQFQRSGPDLGAKTLDEFLTAAHQFGDHPPAGTLRLDRANGDKLLYDPKGNLFAVVTRDGAPRTIFKPRDGMAYWEAQKSRELAQSGGETGSRERSSGYARQGSDDRSSYREDKADRGGQ